MRKKWRIFVDEYLKCWNQTEAARRAGYSERSARNQGMRMMTNEDIQAEIKMRLDESAMSADEVLQRMTEQARASLAPFFKLSERETDNPLPTEEILDEWDEPILLDDEMITKKMYRVRSVVLDLTKLIDPAYAHLVKKFSDSPKIGLSIELHDQQAALLNLGKHRKMFADEKPGQFIPSEITVIFKKPDE